MEHSARRTGAHVRRPSHNRNAHAFGAVRRAWAGAECSTQRPFARYRDRTNNEHPLGKLQVGREGWVHPKGALETESGPVDRELSFTALLRPANEDLCRHLPLGPGLHRSTKVVEPVGPSGSFFAESEALQAHIVQE